jgi:DNA-binding LacI/PurR family transcriptional regulator
LGANGLEQRFGSKEGCLMDRSANQTDVARAAGVSVSTVSRALSNQPGISEDVRVKISKIAQELGYRGRGDAGQAAKVIRAYVTGNAVTGGLVPFYSAIVEGLNTAAARAGLILEIRLIQDRILDPSRFDRDAEEAAASGTMLVGIDPSPDIASWLVAQKTVVLVNTFDPEMRFDCVGPNNFYGGALATKMLIEAGHRSLLHVRDHLRPTTFQRHLGFQSAIAATVGTQGIVVDAPDAGETYMLDIVRQRKAQLTDWTGVYCVHDLAAIRLIHALEAEGFRVPQDISVVGFDDLPAASMMSPRLTTVRVDCQAIGAQAIAMMLRRLADPDTGTVQAECGVTAVAGGTIAQFALI